MMRKYLQGVLALSIAASMAACQDLNVVNENLPDTDRALGEPAEVEQVIRSSFNIWYNRLHGNTDAGQDIWGYYPEVAGENTRTTLIRSIQPTLEPRVALKNDPEANEVWIPRAPWDGFNSGAANTNDGLRQIAKGMRIVTSDAEGTPVADNTDRAYVFAKLFQGINLGYLALTMDRAAPADESTELPKGYDDLMAWERTNMVPYSQVVQMAVHSLEQAIARAEQSPPFTLPESWINGQPYSNTQLAQLAHTMIARFLVYNARSPEDRAQTDWAKVLFHTERGLTYDFGPNLATGVLTSAGYLQRMTLAPQAAAMRTSVRALGPADVSGAYQAWLTTPLGERNAVQIVTPDRRITGATPATNGAYFRYHAAMTGLDAGRGTYTFSHYQWFRRLNYNNFTWNTGQYVLFSVDENRLLRAEALLTSNPAAAAELINVTRTRGVKLGATWTTSNLPPVTAAGVPQSADCVPRTKTGACGTLKDALKYERMIELMGQDPMRAWHDQRGFGDLVPGTLLHMPVPARYLVSIGIPIYTFGGVGGDGAAK
jgi:starch-binding outer membrane protein, SusD/RagB family